MYKLVFHLFLIKLTQTSESAEDILETLNLISPALRQNKAANVDYTCYPPLHNFHVNATPVAASKYRWIADVVHSRTADFPHVCTAACIDDGIFVTAAACIYTLKIKFTTLLYMSTRLVVRAFVFPSVPTRQMFDDIGIIVIDNNKSKGVNWVKINLFTAVNRTDSQFRWLANINKVYNKKINYRVIAHAIEKERMRMITSNEPYKLFELDVIVEHDMCFKAVTLSRRVKHEGYRVPCYSTCPFKDYNDTTKACHNRFLGVEGGAIIDTMSNKFIGVATWGGGDENDMPVGFAFANSDTFYKDLICAKRIRDDKAQFDTKGHYQKLCDKK